VDVVWREHDGNLGPSAIEPASEFLHPASGDLREVPLFGCAGFDNRDVPVRGDAAKDESHRIESSER
jgi:hypothetical protein